MEEADLEPMSPQRVELLAPFKEKPALYLCVPRVGRA